MNDHLIDAEAVNHIARRAESYLDLARRVVVDTFGSESGKDQVHVITAVAGIMANLEHAEILARSQDKLTAILERG